VKRAGIAGLALVLALGLVAGPAQAKKKRVKVATQISITDFQGTPEGFVFSGEVTAAKPRCERSRAVELFYVGGDEPFSIARTTSDLGGHWEVNAGSVIALGDYQATVDRKRIRKKRKILICKAGVSPVFPVP
jgi:hypothetical protein